MSGTIQQSDYLLGLTANMKDVGFVKADGEIIITATAGELRYMIDHELAGSVGRAYAFLFLEILNLRGEVNKSCH